MFFFDNYVTYLQCQRCGKSLAVRVPIEFKHYCRQECLGATAWILQGHFEHPTELE